MHRNLWTLGLDMSHAAFDDAPASEVARILRETAERVESGEGAFARHRIMDMNGNTVGSFGPDEADLVGDYPTGQGGHAMTTPEGVPCTMRDDAEGHALALVNAANRTLDAMDAGGSKAALVAECVQHRINFRPLVDAFTVTEGDLRAASLDLQMALGLIDRREFED